MFDALLVDVEARLHVVDGLAVLNGDDSARGEALSVANSVDFVENGCRRVARAKKVRMQRMHPALFDRSARCHEGLGSNLAAKRSLALLFGIDAPIDVDLDGFEVEE